MNITGMRGHEVPATFVRTEKQVRLVPTSADENRILAVFRVRDSTFSFDLQAVTDILVTSHRDLFGVHTVGDDTRVSPNQLMMDLNSLTKLLKEWQSARQFVVTA